MCSILQYRYARMYISLDKLHKGTLSEIASAPPLQLASRAYLWESILSEAAGGEYELYIHHWDMKFTEFWGHTSLLSKLENCQPMLSMINLPKIMKEITKTQQFRTKIPESQFQL